MMFLLSLAPVTATALKPSQSTANRSLGLPSACTAAPASTIRTAHHSRAGSHIVELFGRRFDLDNPRGVTGYISALDAAIERSKREEPLGKEHEKDPLHHKEPRNFISKKVRHGMELTRDAAKELDAADGEHREALLEDVLVMADAVHGAFGRVLPGNMDVFQALVRQGTLKHPPVGLGDRGVAENLSDTHSDPGEADPELPSGRWNRPADIATKELYYGFGRTELPNFNDVICTYRRSKQSLGVHPGFDVKCKEYGNVKLKMGEGYSQPFAHRIFWALGYNVSPVDCARTVKVKWDPRIFTEFNTHKDETVSVSLFGLFTVYSEHLQHYTDPLSCVSEIVMLDDQGKEITLHPSPDWKEFKRRLYKDPKGRPESRANNFNEAFANRIKYLVYHNVNVQLKDEDDDDSSGEEYIGNWDWTAEGTDRLREARGFVFLSAWVNQYDSWVHNNKLYMTNRDGRREFKYYVTDLGGCLGPAADTTKMAPEEPNRFPWSFTRTAEPKSTAIPLDRSFHNIREADVFRAADIYDARWMGRYLAQLTGPQILEALMSGGMPAAQVRVFYNKLVSRRNKALKDIGLNYPPIKPLDESEQFDYDLRADGPMKIVTSRGETVTAPDDDWVVVKGRVYTRADVQSGRAAREIARMARPAR